MTVSAELVTVAAAREVTGRAAVLCFSVAKKPNEIRTRVLLKIAHISLFPVRVLLPTSLLTLLPSSPDSQLPPSRLQLPGASATGNQKEK